MGRGLLLWMVGVPIPVIILLWFFFHCELGNLCTASVRAH
jgi:hypothetical protein